MVVPWRGSRRRKTGYVTGWTFPIQLYHLLTTVEGRPTTRTEQARPTPTGTTVGDPRGRGAGRSVRTHVDARGGTGQGRRVRTVRPADSDPFPSSGRPTTTGRRSNAPGGSPGSTGAHSTRSSGPVPTTDSSDVSGGTRRPCPVGADRRYVATQTPTPIPGRTRPPRDYCGEAGFRFGLVRPVTMTGTEDGAVQPPRETAGSTRHDP